MRRDGFEVFKETRAGTIIELAKAATTSLNDGCVVASLSKKTPPCTSVANAGGRQRGEATQEATAVRGQGWPQQRHGCLGHAVITV